MRKLANLIVIAILIVVGGIRITAAEENPTVALLSSIVPENGPVCPPYEMARYDLGLEPQKKIPELTSAALARQDKLETRWKELKELRVKNQLPADSHWILLSYAFGEASVEDALKAARQLGDPWRFKMARLLLSECRFNTAIAELISLVDAGGAKSKPALLQLVVLHEQAKTFSPHIQMVPFEIDLDKYLEKLSQDPLMAQLINAIRQNVKINIAPCLQTSIIEQLPEEPPRDIEIDRITEDGVEILFANLQLHDIWDTAQHLLANNHKIESLDKAFLETSSTQLVLYREGSGSAVITEPKTDLKLHTDCGGEIEFKLYRFDQKDEWLKLDAKLFVNQKPIQTWKKEFKPLRENNRGAPKEYTATVENLTEGYYLATAEARYLPFIAAQKFTVSNIALYLRTSPNQAIVSAVDRRTGEPVANLPVRLSGDGHPVWQTLSPEDAAGHSEFFRAGFNKLPYPEALNSTLKTADLDKKLDEYQAGIALRARYPDINIDLTKTTGANGIAEFPLDLLKGYNFNIKATRQTVGFAEAQVDVNMPSKPADSLKTIIWTAQPIYRPGDLVHFNGVTRRFDGLRVAPHDTEWKKEVKVKIEKEKELLWEGTCKLTATGSFNGEFTIPASASLGNYDMLVDEETASPSAALKIQQFKVPTFRVHVSPDSYTYAAGKLAKGTVSVKYSFGKPVANAEVELAFECGDGQAKPYTFFTDSEGIASFELPVPVVPEKAHGTVRATVIDASGESYSGFGNVSVTPAAFKLEAAIPYDRTFIHGEKGILRLNTFDWKHNPLPGVTISMVGSNVTKVTDDKGIADIEFIAPNTGNSFMLNFTGTLGKDAVHLSHQVRLEKRPEPVPPSKDGVAKSAAEPQPVGKEAVKTEPVRKDKLHLDIEQYPNAGQPIKAKLKVERITGGKSFVLLCVENTRLLSYQAMQLEPGEHEIKLDTNLDYSPTCELIAIMFTGKNILTDSHTVFVKPVQRFLTLEVATDKTEYKPGEKCRAEIIAYDWQKRPVPNTEISLGVINEALYGLQRDCTPDLQNFFHSYSLPHWSWNKYDEEAPFCPAEVWLKGPKLAWGYWTSDFNNSGRSRGGSISALRRYGGSAFGERSSFKNVRIDFRNEAFWVANLVTNGEGRAKVEFSFPDNITFWRFTARGITADTLVGEVTRSHRTFLPTQVELSLPRALRAGDRITANAVVHNNTDQARIFALSFGGDAGNGKEKLSVPAQGTARAGFRLAPLNTNPLKLRAAVQLPQSEEGDAIERPLPVLPGGYPVSRSFHGQLKDNPVIPLTFDLPSQPEELELTLRIESGVVGPVISAIDSLIDYPYGCVEQTMSRFLPAVIAGRAMKKAQLPFSKEKELPKILEKGIQRLSEFQHKDGGWGWWKDDQSNDFMTAYVLEGLTLCREAGHAVPAGMLEESEDYLFKRLNSDKPKQMRKVCDIGEVSPAIYMAHTLALYYSSEKDRYKIQLERLNTMLPNLEKEIPLPRDRVLLADTCRLLGLAERAKALIGEVSISLKSDDRSDIMAAATLLEVSEAIEPGRAENIGLARQLISFRRGSKWCDTQTTANIVRGLSSLIKPGKIELSPVDVIVDGESVARLEPKADAPARLVLKKEIANKRTITLKPSQTSSVDCFWSAHLSGYASKPLPAPKEPLAKVVCQVFKAGPAEQEILPDSNGSLNVKQGDTLRIRLTCSTKKPLNYLRISLPRPCGVELVRPPKRTDPKKTGRTISFEEHDSGFHFFVDQCDKEMELDFLVRAQVSGQVFSPPPELEPMYGNSIPVQAEGSRTWNILGEKTK